MRRLFTFLLAAMVTVMVSAQGIPFFKNVMASEYHGNKLNFDVITDKNGNVFIANFEGLICYNNAQYYMIHTPGVTRVTSLYCDAKGKIWAGGYNFIGMLKVNSKGNMELANYDEKHRFEGEVQDI